MDLSEISWCKQNNIQLLLGEQFQLEVAAKMK